MRKFSTAVPSGARLHRCGACGAQYRRQESLELHEGCCVRQATTPQTSPGASAYDCQYCGKPWPNRMSLAQHIRNKHMADSQRDRNQEVVVAAPTRQLWTEERREAFLDIADRVGWSMVQSLAHCLSSGTDGPADSELQDKVPTLELAGPTRGVGRWRRDGGVLPGIWIWHERCLSLSLSRRRSGSGRLASYSDKRFLSLSLSHSPPLSVS